jgi:YesN/AraC family two-component response regulator
VIEADNGRHAKRVLKTEAVDLVITDLVMPEVDGLELLMYARKTASVIPFIAMCGLSVHAGVYLQAAKHLGAVSLLVKPVDKETLNQAVGTAMLPPLMVAH